MQLNDKFSNPIFACTDDAPPPSLLHIEASTDHARTLLVQMASHASAVSAHEAHVQHVCMYLYTQTTGSCDAACPHPPYNQGSKLCRACPQLETKRTSVRLRSQVGTGTPAMRIAHECTHIPHTHTHTHTHTHICAGICNPGTGAYMATYTATMAGKYSLALFVNGSEAREAIYYRGPGRGSLDVLPR